jgi:tetratricopeptide (TPR) repeat protein
MAVNIPPNAPQHVYAAAAEQALEWGRADGALQVAELGLSRHPGYTGLRCFRAEALLKHNRQEEAEEDLRAVLNSEPQHPRALKMISYLLMDQRRYREALRFLQRAEFVILDDAEITEWLGVAEARAEEAPPAPPPTLSLLYTPDVQARAQELASVPGVHAVLLADEGDKRTFGSDGGKSRLDLERMDAVERTMGEVLQRLGFGCLTDVSLQTGDTTLTSRRSHAGVVRVAADSRLREGLIAWHAAKVLGEDSV